MFFLNISILHRDPFVNRAGTPPLPWPEKVIRHSEHSTGGRAVRLLDLTTNEDQTARGGAGPDPESEILGFFEIPKNHRYSKYFVLHEI